MVKERIKLFTSESVLASHPDKFTDSVVNYLHDKYLEGDKNSKTGIEASIFGRNIYVGGEVNSRASVDIIEGVKYVLEDVGYNPEDYIIKNDIIEQSDEINSMVDREDGEVGAGDQGIATYVTVGTEKTNYIGETFYLAHRLAERLEYVRKNKVLPYIQPDGKTQVTGKYNQQGEFVGVDTVIVSARHTEDIELEDLREDIKREVIDYVLDECEFNNDDIRYLINHAGKFTKGFGDADSGLTSRKLAVDFCSFTLGGGGLSGKNLPA